MNESRISRWLIIGAMLVAATRYVGVFAHSEGWLIAGDVWQWLVALSGLGMAVLEGVAVWYCWQAWSNAKPNRERDILLLLIIAMFITLALMVAPYTYSASHKELTVTALSDWLQVVWAVAVSVAPLVVMAAAGLAEKLRPVDAQDAQGEVDVAALVSQAVEGAINALKPEFDRVAQMAQQADTAITEMHGEMNQALRAVAHDYEMLQREVTEARNSVMVLPQPAVMSAPTVSADERAAQYLLQNPTANSEQVAQHLGVSAARVRALPAWRNRQPA